jgi:hypothetical protein
LHGDEVWSTDLILMDPCIVDYSVEIPTRCSFVIEFIIPKFFLKARHVSSGTPVIIRSSKLYLQPLVYMPIWWTAIAKAGWGKFFPISLDNGRSPYGYINQRLQIQFRARDDERCAARNMLSLQKKLWNNKFYYKAASCWLLSKWNQTEIQLRKKFPTSYGIQFSKSNFHGHRFEPLDPIPNYLYTNSTHT